MGYFVEIKTGILTSDNTIHTWVELTAADGTKEAWGLYPDTDSFGNTIYGPGDIRPEPLIKPFTSSSGPISLSAEQHNQLKQNITTQDATPPNYSILALPGGEQCSTWALDMLHDVGAIPSALTSDAIPGLSAIYETLIYNPLWQTIGFLISDSVPNIFEAVQRWIRPRYDPLTLDLNGNGLETVAPQIPPILFDHQNNGLKQSTGWVAPNDGFLVLDRNGNGTIDSGALRC